MLEFWHFSLSISVWFWIGPIALIVRNSMRIAYKKNAKNVSRKAIYSRWFVANEAIKIMWNLQIVWFPPYRFVTYSLATHSWRSTDFHRILPFRSHFVVVAKSFTHQIAKFRLPLDTWNDSIFLEKALYSSQWQNA